MFLCNLHSASPFPFICLGNTVDFKLPSSKRTQNEEMAHLVKCLLHKYEDTSPDPQCLQKSWVWQRYVSVTPVLRKWTQVIPRAPWPASLSESLIEFQVQ